MSYAEDDYLMLSGLQHFAFCRRQWALIHVEGQWKDNLRTVKGNIMHERAHEEGTKEKRGSVITIRALRVSSKTLGISGICDVVEFHKSENGICLKEEIGRWQPFPVEYKVGLPKEHRPPLDCVNAMLSFAYSLLASACASALESVGLDSYVGFMHVDRPGRMSLALDLMEELRPVIADRFVIYCINKRIVNASMFMKSESGGVLLNEKGRTAFLKTWQDRKKEMLTHPYLKEKVVWGLVPYLQALLLARHLRGDTDQYPPFLWK